MSERGRRDGANPEVDRVARLLMAEWARVEHKPVNTSYVATFADMARVVIADRQQVVDAARLRMACEQAIDGALGELARQAGYQMDLRMLKEARGAGLLAVFHLIEGRARTAEEDAEQASGRRNVERVVRDAVLETERTAATAVPIHRIDDIVRRAADRLCVLGAATGIEDGTPEDIDSIVKEIRDSNWNAAVTCVLIGAVRCAWGITVRRADGRPARADVAALVRRTADLIASTGGGR